MSMHLEEIAFHIAPGAHAVVPLDQAGWHGSAELDVPLNITLMPLSPRCPELNPVENMWQFMRDNWLSNRIPIIRRHRRPLLLRMEQARRSAMPNYVYRPTRMGPWVMINVRRYNTFCFVQRYSRQKIMAPFHR